MYGGGPERFQDGGCGQNHTRRLPACVVSMGSILRLMAISILLKCGVSTRPPVRRVMPAVRLGLRTLDRERQLLHVQRRTDVMKIDAMARILENGRIDRETTRALPRPRRIRHRDEALRRELEPQFVLTPRADGTWPTCTMIFDGARWLDVNSEPGIELMKRYTI